MPAPSHDSTDGRLQSGFRLGGLSVDPNTGEVIGSGGTEKLDPKVMSVLLVLAQNAGQVVLREDLISLLWPKVVVTDEVLTRCVYELRRQLTQAAGDDRFKELIETLPKRGYRLRGEVSPSPKTLIRLRRNWRRAAIAIATVAIVAAIVVGMFVPVMDSVNPPQGMDATPFSIAVLPFVDLSPGRDQGYLADGMAEELLNMLAQVPDLKVIARTSSFAFKGKNVEIGEIAKKLNVAYILEGSVQTSGSRLRVTAQLVRAADGSQLWSNRYDRTMDDIFAVQNEIANAVVSELKIKLLGTAPKARGRNPEAFALYLKARYVGQQLTPLAYEQAITLYRQAVKLEPRYAEAWEGLANTYGNQALDNVHLSDEVFPVAIEAAQRALALDPQFALAHARLGWIAIYYNQDYSRASRHLKHALELDEGNPAIIEVAAVLLRRIGRLDQAIALGEYAVGRDPLNADAYFDLGLAYKYARQWDAAIAQFRSVIALSPSAVGARGAIGEVRILQGKPEAALAEAQLETDHAWQLHVESLAFQALDRLAESEAALTEMIDSRGIKSATFIVEEAAFRGEIDRAFYWLDQAAEVRDPDLGALWLSPFCENLHNDPRWQRFLRKHGMAPEQLAAVKFDFELPR